MKVLLLYMLLLKATLTTFSGLASLPMLRNDLVLHRNLLTDSQLNTAIVVTRRWYLSDAVFTVAGLGIAVRSTVLPSPITLPTPKPSPAARMSAAAITQSLKRLFRQAPGMGWRDFAASFVPTSFSARVRCRFSSTS